MEPGAPTPAGDVPSGATMRPRYMGRIMNTYPVSEPEMENISSLSAQASVRFSVASLLLGLAASIWTNAMFYKELTPEGVLASHYVAPLMLVFSVGFALGGFWVQRKRASAWEKIKQDSNPIEAVATTREILAPQQAAG
jgi:hypothetical protein